MTDPRAPLRPESNVSGLRVVMVICGFELGGAERQAILLARELTARGALAEVWGLFGPASGAAADLCNRYGVPWRVLWVDWTDRLLPNVKALVRLARVFRAAGVDVILPYTMYPNVICGAMWRLTRASLCIWNQRDEGHHRMHRLLEWWAVRQSPLFVSNSTHAVSFLTDVLQIDPRVIRRVPNGVHLDAPRADRQTWRERLGLQSTTFVAVMVANLHRFKDHDTLLRAWRLVVDRSQDSGPPVLLLAGRPDTAAADVAALVSELALDESVRLLGQVDDVTGLLESSDLCVFSSENEGLPNAVLEAMAVGLPVVATDIPGVREAVGGEGAAYLFPPKDSHRLADLVLEMVRNPATRAMTGARNRVRVRQCYSVASMVEPMADAIGRAVTRRGPRAARIIQRQEIAPR